MTDEELDALVEWLDELPCCHDGPHETSARCKSCEKTAADAITALRAQLAEVKAERDAVAEARDMMGRLWEKEKARADRAEAERAAQIEDACAVIDCHAEHDQSFCCDGRECGCQGVSVHDMMKHFIRQPHDRTALDRMLAEAREKALREAAGMFDADSNIAQTILAMIEGGK